MYAAAGETEASAAQVRKVIELAPKEYSYRITLAGLYWNMGQQAKAKDLLQELLSEKPDDETIRLDVAGFLPIPGSGCGRGAGP